MRIQSLTAAYALDWIAGDPQWLPHPVRLIGKATHTGEHLLRRLGSGRSWELVSGAALATCITVGSGVAVWSILRTTHRVHPRFAVFSEILLGSMCLASRNLLDEAHAVLNAIGAADLSRARQRLSRIVGRDTASLDECEIARAVIETLAESLCDGVIAPLFYLTLGGVPLAIAYKAVNTLDSMIGHRDEQYLWFGKTAARLDDAANYLPARITALLLCGSAAILQPGSFSSALSTWRRDGRKHASPNAGQVESAMAGALRVRLGGKNTYQGEPVEAPLLGSKYARPSAAKARQALTVTALASCLGWIAACAFLAVRKRND